jgi:hypothetical protein
MAVYKVPQDVEADDKLIGPFSFRQFIYLIIVAISGALAWALSQVFIPLAIIPLPLIIFFGALALPLRKDQPMEIYLAAIVSYYLKPRKSLWQTDGIHSLVEITVPKVIETHLVKDLSQSEAEQRLSYLATIVDTGGWAVRGVAAAPEQNTAMNDDMYFEAQAIPDVLDEGGGIAQTFGDKLQKDEAKHKQELMERMRQPASPNIVIPAVSVPVPTPALAPLQQNEPSMTPTAAVTDTAEPKLVFNPYPGSIHQSVIKPMDDQKPVSTPVSATPPVAPAPLPAPLDPLQLDDPYADLPATPPVVQPVVTPEPIIISEKPLSPDIIRLADNSDLSIETIAREADRITKRDEQASEEILVELHKQ